MGNDELKKIIIKIKESNETPSEEVLDKIEDLLKEKTLIYPKITLTDNDLLLLKMSENSFLIPAFTDIDEFEKGIEYMENDGLEIDLEPVEIDIEEMVNKARNLQGFGGLLLNLHDLQYGIAKEFLAEFKMGSMVYNKDQLKGIYVNRINNFLKNDIQKIYSNSDISFEDYKKLENVGNDLPDQIIKDLGKAILITINKSDVDLLDLASSGIIDRHDILRPEMDVKLLSTYTSNGQYAMLFTDKHEVNKELGTIIEDYHIYGQLINIKSFANKIIESDLKGFIINPCSDAYLISKEAIMENIEKIEDLELNPSFSESERYVFPIK